MPLTAQQDPIFAPSVSTLLALYAGWSARMDNPFYRSSALRPTSSTPFSLDEGFSEAFPSQDDHEQDVSTDTIKEFQDWIMAQNEEHRSQIAYEILQTLRTSNIAAVVRRLTPRLHMDPVQRLPPEIMADVFTYLDVHSLLSSTLASRTWRERILDVQLWKKFYIGNCWGFDLDAVRAFDNFSTSSSFRSKGKGRPLLRTSTSNEKSQPSLKRRAMAGWLDDRERTISPESSKWQEQHEPLEADVEEVPNGEDHEMQDAPPPQSDHVMPKRAYKRHSQEAGDEMEIISPYRSGMSTETTLVASQKAWSTDPTLVAMPVQLQPPSKPSLLMPGDTSRSRLNWHYLYKQRRRLEENWTDGRFTNFQLPLAQYPQEAHTECVYTIQFCGKWLVSGSRDKSVRVWDLDTRRLRGTPLWGHTQSVLCLQFDPSEDQDVIISGSSDTGIIVWRFSTGERLYDIPQAHSESVLNLRFDRRYLVTCSKDKVIKVWNRTEMLPNDPAYPRKSSKTAATFPVHIIDVAQYTERQLLEAINLGPIKPLRPYTHLMTLVGHDAAVNAIGIDGDQIVSASGDRHLKLWNVKDGSVVRTFSGHAKGIACVQYDSRRIVSGSSDNTVRIYDPYTGAQVAILQGHINLVRTIQAGFGDAPGNEDELQTEARAAEQAYLEGVRDGTILLDEDRRSHRRNQEETAAGTGDPPVPATGTQTDPSTGLLAFGARLPPGGGGSKWGRIVSGSYDETIIIWRKASDGQWIVGQRLLQEAALQAMEGATSSTPQDPNQPRAAMGPRSAPLPQTNNLAAARAAALPPGVQQARVQLNAHIQNVLQARIQTQTQAPVAGPATQRTAQQATINAGTQTAHQATTVADANTGVLQPNPNLNPNSNQQPSAAPAAPQVPHAAAATAAAAGPANRPPPAQGQGAQNAQQQQQQLQTTSRIFKLQFDARRLICCSQDARIVGWDFAAGDPEIEEASAFFVGP